MQRRILYLFLIASLIGIVFLSKLVFSDCFVLFEGNNIVEYLYKKRILEILIILILITLTLRLAWEIVSEEIWKNIFMSIYVLLNFVLVGELIMMFVPISQGDGKALSARLWFSYYWKLNKYGFRDYDYDVRKLVSDSTEVIALIGDSFTEGHGVKYPRDRFSDILRKKLPQETTLNLGKNGFNTLQEMNLMGSLPFQSKWIVLSHFSNDIDYLLPKTPEINDPILNTRQDSFLNFDGIIGYLNSASFLFSYLYSEWLMVKQNLEIKTETIPKSDIIEEIQTELKSKFKLSKLPSIVDIMHDDSMVYFIQKNYWIKIKGNEPLSTQDLFLIDTIVDKHISNFVTVKNACDSADIKLLVILFPETGENINTTGRIINENMREALQQNHIEVIDLYPIIKDLPLKDRITNKFDVHPNVKVHNRVADTLYRYLVNHEI